MQTAFRTAKDLIGHLSLPLQPTQEYFIKHCIKLCLVNIKAFQHFHNFPGDYPKVYRSCCQEDSPNN